VKIKKGDTVVVIAGKDKGAKGKVIAAYPRQDKVLVEGVNRVKKHETHPYDAARFQDRRHRHPGSPDPHLERADRGRPGQADPRSATGSTTTARRSASRVAPVRTCDDCRYRDQDAAPAEAEVPQRGRAALKEQYKYGNPMQIPGLVKVVVNMGVGEAARDAKLIDGAVRDLTTITGQKPLVRRATKSIAQFKLREGMPIGAKVTLATTGCGSSWTGCCRSRCRVSVTSAVWTGASSTATATTRSV
jgi:hypothetical protein